MQNLATGLLAAALLVIAPRAQTPPTATLTANQPIVAQWVNAPPGTPGAYASQPAGPLTSANVVAGNAGVTWARFSCNVTQGNHVFFSANHSYYPPNPPYSVVSASADLTLLLTVPIGDTIALDVDVHHSGDYPVPQAFQIDLGDDGTVEIDMHSQACCGTTHHRLFTRTPANGVLPVRITAGDDNPPSPQSFSLGISATTWPAGITSVAADCGGLVAHYLPGSIQFTSNYQIAALPPAVANTMARLRAVGAGVFGMFLVSDQAPAFAVQLPPPFTSTCDLLLNSIPVPGTVTMSSTATLQTVPVAWEIDLPLLPPGLVFYVQHASVDLTAPYFFGSTNRIRVQS